MQTEESTTDKPPFLNSWRAMYWLVLGTLLAEIAVFYAITKHFA